MAETGGTYRLGVVLVTASAVAWSTSGLFTRLIEAETWTMLVWRGAFGALGILAVIAALQGRRGLRDIGRLGLAGWVFALVSAAGMLCFMFALRLTTVAHVAIIYATVPLVAAGLAWPVLGERAGRPAILASLLAVMGVAVMVGSGGEGSLLGDLLAFGMTLALAVMMVLSRRAVAIPIMPAACVSAVLSALAAAPMIETLAVSGQDLGLLVAFGVVNSALGLALFSLGARMLPAIETALIGALDAPLAPIWVWMVFGETLSPTTWGGGMIVMGAVAAHLAVQAKVSQSEGAKKRPS